MIIQVNLYKGHQVLQNAEASLINIRLLRTLLHTLILIDTAVHEQSHMYQKVCSIGYRAKRTRLQFYIWYLHVCMCPSVVGGYSTYVMVKLVLNTALFCCRNVFDSLL